MALSVLQEFEDYANFSERVDRFFHTVNIYGMHHNALKNSYHRIPAHSVVRQALRDDRVDEDFRLFCVAAVNSLNYMATTRIFADEGGMEPGTIPEDMLNFSFYTCFCFQWSLFEDFTKKIIRRAIDGGVLAPDTCRALESRWRYTEKFFDYIESGNVFGSTPFRTVLPVKGWVPTTETCRYSDLNRIRELRNSFIHGVSSPEIMPESTMEKQDLYDRSMRILRNFASNLQQDVGRLLGAAGH